MPNMPQYISSYIPSLSSLSPAERAVFPDFKLLSVAISQTKGYEPLPETLTEARYIHEIVPPDLQVSLINEQASTASITSVLPSCPWAHFSCHGVQDHADPFKSGLLVPDGARLHLSDLISLSLPSAQFVFLSACQTGLGDIQLLDESLHLAGGFLFAGFRGAVATLWSMDDADGPVVTREVYAYLFRGGRRTPDLKEVPLALHRAVVMLRARGIPARRWVPFIHMGI